jgi:hypothetical protein
MIDTNKIASQMAPSFMGENLRRELWVWRFTVAGVAIAEASRDRDRVVSHRCEQRLCVWPECEVRSGSDTACLSMNTGRGQPMFKTAVLTTLI